MQVFSFKDNSHAAPAHAAKNAEAAADYGGGLDLLHQNGGVQQPGFCRDGQQGFQLETQRSIVTAVLAQEGIAVGGRQPQSSAVKAGNLFPAVRRQLTAPCDFPVEPRASKAPILLHRSHGKALDRGNLVDFEAGKKPKLHHSALPGRENSELVQSFVERQNLSGIFWSEEGETVQRQLFSTCTAFL